MVWLRTVGAGDDDGDHRSAVFHRREPSDTKGSGFRPGTSVREVAPARREVERTVDDRMQAGQVKDEPAVALEERAGGADQDCPRVGQWQRLVGKRRVPGT